jgi:MarR family 2-MHQ and catechol resistance regulon transcriptional repressor
VPETLSHIHPDTARALKLWVVMNRASATVAKALRSQVEARGLGLTEFGVLEVLLHKGALPISAIGGNILLTSGSMTYVIDKLEKRGWIARRACGEDRRVTYIDLTAEGRSVIEPVFKEHAELLRDLFVGIDPEEQETATQLLRRLGLHVRDRSAVTAA